jgi:hypothetical protein
VLHVQSISAWAPACIGPYAQAAAWGSVLHMAGQIGLDPASMQVVAGGAAAQARPRPRPRCLRHALQARPTTSQFPLAVRRGPEAERCAAIVRSRLHASARRLAGSQCMGCMPAALFVLGATSTPPGHL